MLIENTMKGKPAMIVGVIIAIIGLFAGSGFLILVGIIVFAIGKILHWLFN